VDAAGMCEVAGGMQQLSLGGAGDVAVAARGPDSHRRGALRYVGANTRPPHVTNKQGLVHVTHTHTRLTALFPGLPRWAGARKVKPICILLKQETVSGSGISWAYASLHLAPDR